MPRKDKPVLQETIGPTPEQLAKGGYAKPEGEAARGGLAVYTNTHPDILAKLRAHQTLTARQFKAGRAFEAPWCRVKGHSSPSRDSTIPPLGGMSHESESQAERWANANGRLKVILQKVHPMRYNLLISVCCYGESLGDSRLAAVRLTRKLLLEALDVCAEVYGIEKGNA
jgi:hypothetical protein